MNFAAESESKVQPHVGPRKVVVPLNGAAQM